MDKRGRIKKREGERGANNLPKMSTGDAKPWANDGRSRKRRGREWNTNLTIMVADDTNQVISNRGRIKKREKEERGMKK